jgi:hypothetical protein
MVATGNDRICATPVRNVPLAVSRYVYVAQPRGGPKGRRRGSMRARPARNYTPVRFFQIAIGASALFSV